MYQLKYIISFYTLLILQQLRFPVYKKINQKRKMYAAEVSYPLWPVSNAVICLARAAPESCQKICQQIAVNIKEIVYNVYSYLFERKSAQKQICWCSSKWQRKFLVTLRSRGFGFRKHVPDTLNDARRCLLGICLIFCSS